MINPSQCEFIVKVFLCHPTPHILEEPDVKKAKLAIKKRYRDIRNANRSNGNPRFTESEIEAKAEWLKLYLTSLPKN